MLTYDFCLKLEFPKSYGCACQLLFLTVLPISAVYKMFRQTGKQKKIEQPKNEDKNVSHHWVISGQDKLYNTTSGYFAVLRKRESSKLHLPEAPISNFFQSHRRLLCNCMCYLTKLGIWIAICSLTQVKFFPQADHTSQKYCRYCNRQHIVKIIIVFP